MPFFQIGCKHLLLRLLTAAFSVSNLMLTQFQVEQKGRSFSLCLRDVQQLQWYGYSSRVSSGDGGGHFGLLPAGLPLPINSPVFVTRCAARRWLSWHKERLCQICDMMLICVRCRGTHSQCSPLPAISPAPFLTERSLVFKSRDDNRDRRRKKDGEAPDGYISREEQLCLWCHRLQHFSNSLPLFPSKFRQFPLTNEYFDDVASTNSQKHQVLIKTAQKGKQNTISPWERLEQNQLQMECSSCSLARWMICFQSVSLQLRVCNFFCHFFWLVESEGLIH